jgi:hypothetical protein
MPVILIYAPGTMSYGEMMAFARPAVARHPTVYVFLRED